MNSSEVYADEVINARNRIVCPGFIDIQINGAFGYDFSDPSITKEQINHVCRNLLSSGCTAICPTIITSAFDTYHRNLQLFAYREGSVEEGCAILGAHCEGPFISPQRSGAHPPEYVRAPVKGAESVRECYGDTSNIKIVTMAPELEGALDATKYLVEQGITVSMGHTAAHINQAIDGVGAGQWYNTFVAPVAPLAVRGFVWYQGENNVGNNVQYEPLFKGLINNWREIWGNNFPFYFVQLAGYQQPVEVQPGSQWAALRWAQQKALELDNTGMATAVDVGETDDIHPKNKQEVARRLSLLALKNTYGFTDIIDKAPELKSYSFTNRKAVLTFSAPLTVKEVALPRGFIMQTSTGSFVKGRCTLENDSTISVSGTFTGAPISVRYNWADFPNGNLYGENDLPVLPFRTDQMDGVINDIETVKTDSNDKTVDVVTTDGVVVRRNADHSSATSGLPEGVYIVGSKKVLVK